MGRQSFTPEWIATHSGAERENAEWDIAQQYYRRGDVPFYEDVGVLEKYNQLTMGGQPLYTAPASVKQEFYQKQAEYEASKQAKTTQAVDKLGQPITSIPTKPSPLVTPPSPFTPYIERQKNIGIKYDALGQPYTPIQSTATKFSVKDVPAQTIKETIRPSISKPAGVVSVASGEGTFTPTIPIVKQSKIKDRWRAFQGLLRGEGGGEKVFSYKKYESPTVKDEALQRELNIQKILTSTLLEKKQIDKYNVELKFGQLTPESYEPIVRQQTEKNILGEYQPILEKYASNLQTKINVGDITYESGLIDLEKYQTQIQKEAQAKYEKEYMTKMRIGELAFSRLEPYKPKVTEYGGAIYKGALIAGLTATTIYNPTPASLTISSYSPALKAGVAGMLWAGGTADIIKATTMDTSASTKEKFLTTLSGTLKISAGASIISGGVIEPIRRSITMGEIQEAFTKTPRLNIGVRKVSAKGELYETYYGTAKAGGATRYSQIRALSKPIPQTKLYGSIAERYDIVKGYEFATGKPIIAGVKSYSIGKGIVLPQTKGVTSSIVYSKSFPSYEFLYQAKTLDVSDNYDAIIKLYRQPKTTENLMAGISKRYGKNIYQISGNIKRIDYAYNQGQEKLNILFDKQEYNILRLDKLKKSSSSVSKYTSLTKKKDIVSMYDATKISPSQPISKMSLITKNIITKATPARYTIYPLVRTSLRSAVVTSGAFATSLSIPQVRQRSFLLPASSVYSLQRPSLKERTISKLGSATLSKLDLKYRSDLIRTNIAPPTTITPSYNIPSLAFPIVPLPKFPKIEGGGRAVSSRRKKRKTRFGYIPSLTGSVLNIRLKKAPRFGGSLQIRGIVD